jgi:hypothetical protein
MPRRTLDYQDTVPELATVDKLGIFPELLVIIGKQPIGYCAQHAKVDIQFPQLAGVRSSKRIEAATSTSGFADVALFRRSEKSFGVLR